jgi:hypothetical protein
MIDAVISEHRARAREEHLVTRFYGLQARALGTFDQHFDGPVGKLQHLQDIGHAANVVQVVGFRFVLDRRLLGNEQDTLARFHRHFQSLD